MTLLSLVQLFPIVNTQNSGCHILYFRRKILRFFSDTPDLSHKADVLTVAFYVLNEKVNSWLRTFQNKDFQSTRFSSPTLKHKQMHRKLVSYWSPNKNHWSLDKCLQRGKEEWKQPYWKKQLSGGRNSKALKKII
jgi:hypothetical protein